MRPIGPSIFAEGSVTIFKCVPGIDPNPNSSEE